MIFKIFPSFSHKFAKSIIIYIIISLICLRFSPQFHRNFSPAAGLLAKSAALARAQPEALPGDGALKCLGMGKRLQDGAPQL